MTKYTAQLVSDWNLSSSLRDQLSVLPIKHLQSCYDINIALCILLGSIEMVGTWMWQPKYWLYHMRPVEVVLSSHYGCENIRLCLLKDLADSQMDCGVYAAIRNRLVPDVLAAVKG